MARFRAISGIIQKFIPTPQARILDIGCATGRLLSLLKRRGYHNLLGLDPSPVCAETAQRLYGIRVLTNTLSDLPTPERSFDFLILEGVLEHIRDLGASLTKLRSILSADGYIYVAVPDASRYTHGEDAPFQEFSVEHINFLGPISLANLMHANGFIQVFCQQDLISVSYRTTTPVIRAIYQKGGTVSNSASITRDTETEQGLVEYIHQSRQADEQIRRTINEIASSGKPIIVWGTGAHTLRLLATSRLSETKIDAFVDSNPRYQGKQLNGTPIIAPTDLKDRSEPILISSRVFQREIERQIRDELKYSNELILLYQF